MNHINTFWWGTTEIYERERLKVLETEKTKQLIENGKI